MLPNKQICAVVLIAAFLSMPAQIVAMCPYFSYAQCPGSGNWSFAFTVCQQDYDCMATFACDIAVYMRTVNGKKEYRYCEKGCGCLEL